MVEMKAVLKAFSERWNKVTNEQLLEQIIIGLHHLLTQALSESRGQKGSEKRHGEGFV